MKGNRHAARTRLVAAIVMALPVAAVPVAAESAPVSRVWVDTPRHVVWDTAQRAAFEVEGGCVTGDDVVTVLIDRCGQAGMTSGAVQSAVLGFDAAHEVEALDEDVPVARTAWRGAETQLSVVTVRVSEPGQLSVRVAAEAAEGFDAQVVAGSAAPAPSEADARAVGWTATVEEPGVYRFRAAFAQQDTADEPFGTFLPGMSIELTRSDGLLLRSLHRDVVADGSAVRTTAVRMRQHLAPAEGKPALSDTGFYPAPNAHGLMDAFAGQLRLDAAGHYHAPTAGEITHSVGVDFADFDPAADRAFTSYLSTSLITPASKAMTYYDFPSPADFGWGIRTARIAEETGLDPLGGTIWDADSVYAAITGAGVSVGIRTDRTPADSNGAITLDWDGSWAREWATTVANHLPAGEGNRLNAGAALRGLADPLFGASRYGTTLLSQAVIPVMLQGGDLDNRDGEHVLTGETLSIRAPADHAVASWILFTYSPAGLAFEPGVSVPFNPLGDFSLTLTPGLKPGGHWLESSRDGYRRDWSPAYVVLLASGPQARMDLDPSHQATLLDVPAGLVVNVDLFDNRGHHAIHLEQPGRYVIAATDTGLSVRLL